MIKLLLAKDFILSKTSLMSFFKDKRSLYIGCNNGRFLNFDRKNFFGFDVCLSYLKEAKNFSTKIICANANNIPLKTSSFETVYSSIFEHLNEYSTKKVIHEIHRITSFNGTFILKCSLAHFPVLFFKNILGAEGFEIAETFYLGKWHQLKFVRLVMHILAIFFPFVRESFLIISRKKTIL